MMPLIPSAISLTIVKIARFSWLTNAVALKLLRNVLLVHICSQLPSYPRSKWSWVMSSYISNLRKPRMPMMPISVGWVCTWSILSVIRRSSTLWRKWIWFRLADTGVRRKRSWVIVAHPSMFWFLMWKWGLSSTLTKCRLFKLLLTCSNLLMKQNSDSMWCAM